MSAPTAIKNILLPTDFSKLSDNALSTAIAMCKRHNATLHLLHVVENRFLMAPPESNITSIYVVPEMETTAKKLLDQLIKKITGKHDIKLASYLEFGLPADSIRDKAIELNCQLIVMGTHGASGFRELFMGNTAYAVIKNTNIPVLTIPGHKKVKDFKRILFPVRAAKGIMDKYDFIEPVIEKNQAELIVLGLSLKNEIFNLSDRQDEMIELGRSLGIHDTAFKSDFHVCNNYAKKVLEIAKKEKVDLIVINATIDYNLSQFFIGPYAQQIVNHAKTPVLSIRTFNSFAEEKSGTNEQKSAVN